MKTKNIFLLLTVLALSTHISFAQNDSLQVKTLMNVVSLDVRVIRITDCKKNESLYYVVSNNDSLLFRYWASDCYFYTRFDNKDSVNFKFRELNGAGKPELLVEYGFSFGSSFGKELIIFNLDSLGIMFRGDLEKYIPAASEPPAVAKWTKKNIIVTNQGNIRIENPEDPSNYSEYILVNGVYILMDK